METPSAIVTPNQCRYYSFTLGRALAARTMFPNAVRTARRSCRSLPRPPAPPASRPPGISALPCQFLARRDTGPWASRATHGRFSRRHARSFFEPQTSRGGRRPQEHPHPRPNVGLVGVEFHDAALLPSYTACRAFWRSASSTDLFKRYSPMSARLRTQNEAAIDVKSNCIG
jgi:hypothetical protein